MSQEIDNIKSEILSRLNLQSEFKSFGIQMTGKPSSKGWIKCPSPFNPDKLPSCGVCVDNSSGYAGYLRIFNNSGPRQAIGFFDLAAELNSNCSGKEFIEILKYYADKTGIEFDLKKKKKVSTKSKGKIIETYDYCNISGELKYQVCRMKPKSFRQRRPDPKNSKKWIWDMQGVSALPYKIQNVVNNNTIYIVEGEQCANDIIKKFQLPATTFHGGAGKWYPEVLPYFKNKNLILLPDNDDVGHEHMERLSSVFKDTAKSIKIIKLSDLKKKGDISDWIDSGGTKDKLLDLCKKTIEVEELEDPIDELNKSHAVIMVGGKIRILYETTDIEDKPDIYFLSDYDFKLLYANRKVLNPLAGQKGQAKYISLALAWLNSPKRREYKSIMFEPGFINDKFYNLYKGLNYKPVKGDWSLFKKHLFENICSNNMEIFDWFIAWLARITQYPGGKKPGTAIVLRGERGTGKGVFAEIFGAIFGHHFLQITNSKQAIGQFNSHLKDCILLFLDEAWFAGNKLSEGVLKGMITSSKHMIEFKGKDSFMVSNHVNCIVASNSSWVVPVGNKERRFCVLDVGNKHLQDHEYFRAIDKQMYEQDGISAMLYDLLNIDISKFNLREAPKTQGLFDQLMQNFSSFEKFWFEILLSNFDFDDENGIQTAKLYDKYTDFCKKLNIKYIITASVFGRNLANYCDVAVERKYTIDNIRSRFYIFPGREACKKQFSDQIGMKIPWGTTKKQQIEIEIDEI